MTENVPSSFFSSYVKHESHVYFSILFNLEWTMNGLSLHSKVIQCLEWVYWAKEWQTKITLNKNQF